MPDATYRVVAGDTLFEIATRYNTSVKTLVQANCILNPDRILVGQLLRIPRGNLTTAAPTNLKEAPARTPLADKSQAKPQRIQATSASSPNGYKSVNLDSFLSIEQSSNSPAAIIIGNAEGTRTPHGGKTRAFGSHTDPGNSKVNKGSFSYQDGVVKTPDEADRKQLKSLRARIPEYLKAAKSAGLDPNNILLAAAFFDSRNQSQAAGDRFLKQLPYLNEKGITPEAIVEARVRSWVDPRTAQRYLTKKGKPVAGGLAKIAQRRAKQEGRIFRGEVDVIREIRSDQKRRVMAMVDALKAQGLTTP
ncbi:LysM peptidoglycan-binding domain-containing protein [Corallococcus sp. CA054B]|uniref:LysM peptidoglycan-binding domain-containing protein n=1 Tax=Corallococcus sp. CA054B TaxID=2316734 RepID=UPI000EA19016|nr:LysM domain-containing protein [Corallococcus sp. CA054B]RKG61727.1 LysM peptidoglycan-binding domain-containing protein [Corallococcus sp. CA054B]